MCKELQTLRDENVLFREKLKELGWVFINGKWKHTPFNEDLENDLRRIYNLDSEDEPIKMF
jgi:hypothetical protein